jgi:transposase-like protein
MSLEAIGERAGKHPSTVSYWLQKYGLQAKGADRRAPKGGVTREELEPLIAEGLTIEGIARRLGVGDTTARNWLKRHRLQTRGARRRAALATMRRTGDKDTQLECRRHGLTRFVAVGSEPRLRCARCRSEAVARRRRRVKETLVAEAGGRCVPCGYQGTRQHSSSTISILRQSPSAWVFGESLARSRSCGQRPRSAFCCAPTATPRWRQVPPSCR